MKIGICFSSSKYNRHRNRSLLVKVVEKVSFIFFFFSREYTEVHCSGGDILMASCMYISINNTDNCKNKKGKRILSTLRRYYEFLESR